jgi:hypothetical protein
MDTRTASADDILRQMAAIRRDRLPEVRESVAEAGAIIDWGRYAWTYPWVLLGVAVGIGYSLTHGKPRSVASSEPVSAEQPQRVMEMTPTSSRSGHSLLLAAWTFLLPVALRIGQNFLINWVDQQQRAGSNTPRPSPGAAAARSEERVTSPSAGKGTPQEPVFWRS